MAVYLFQISIATYWKTLLGGTLLIAGMYVWILHRLNRLPADVEPDTDELDEGTLEWADQTALELCTLDDEQLIELILVALKPLGIHRLLFDGEDLFPINGLATPTNAFKENRFVLEEKPLSIFFRERIYDTLLQDEFGRPVSLAIQRKKGTSRLGLRESYSRKGLGLFQQHCRQLGRSGIYVYMGLDSEGLRRNEGVHLVSVSDLVELLDQSIK